MKRTAYAWKIRHEKTWFITGSKRSNLVCDFKDNLEPTAQVLKCMVTSADLSRTDEDPKVGDVVCDQKSNHLLVLSATRHKTAELLKHFDS